MSANSSQRRFSFETVLSWTVLLACLMVIAYGLHRLSTDADAFRASFDDSASGTQLVDEK